MKTEEVTKRERELFHLYNEAKDASKQFADMCAFTAIQAETTPAVVRRYIAAVSSEKANAVIAETEQLVILFQALPTVQGQVTA